MQTEQIETASREAYDLLSSMEPGDALYLHRDGRVEIGRSQPSNTLCLTTYSGPDDTDDDYLTRVEIERRISEWLAETAADRD